MKNEQLISLLLECGAHAAEAITASQLVTNPVFRDACASGACRIYGKCHMCPPDAGTPEELMAWVHSFARGAVFQTVTPLDDPFDMESMSGAGLELNRLARNIRRTLAEAGVTRFAVLGAGGCRFCTPCTKVQGLPCAFPREALLSMEACCIDVGRTIASTSLEYNHGKNTVTFFGMVLLDQHADFTLELPRN